ncbi:zinc ribbon domain-containing protein [Candidatus Nitrososphaera sp. FF02]|uniref:zinc ribbon domain-containing protein n=1 Tax=Candidatus Nitrososphaera sp. FF02 TaxID=3398226 RepID=UPI0039EA769B
MSVRYCSSCGAERVADAQFCHKCGTSFAAPLQSQKDHFGLGLLLIKIGAVLAATLPFLTLLGINVFSGGAFFGSMPGMFAGIIVAVIGIGMMFGVVTYKFYQDIRAGNHNRITHTLILAAVMFFLGSNIAGIIVGIGAFLCYTSPRRMTQANRL